MNRWQREPSVLWRRSGSRVVALPCDADECVLLDGVGTLIWDQLEEPATAEELVQDLAATFPEEPVTTIRTEIGQFLGQLHASRIVTCT